MGVVLWEILGAALVLLLYRLIPQPMRSTSHRRGLILNVIFLLITGGGLLWTVVAVNGYDCHRLGIGLQFLGPATVAVSGTTAFAALSLWLIARSRGSHPRFTMNMIKLVVPYTPWAYVQELVGLGIAVNLLHDCFGTIPAIVIAAAGFQAVHNQDLAYRILTGVIGGVFAGLFMLYPNLLPFAVSHAAIGILNFYWIKKADKWRELFG